MISQDLPIYLSNIITYLYRIISIKSDILDIFIQIRHWSFLDFMNLCDLPRSTYLPIKYHYIFIWIISIKSDILDIFIQIRHWSFLDFMDLFSPKIYLSNMYSILNLHLFEPHYFEERLRFKTSLKYEFVSYFYHNECYRIGVLHVNYFNSIIIK